MCYKLCGYCSGVILPLMRRVELVQYIEYRDDGYFTLKLPLFLYLYVSTSFFGLQSSSPGGLFTVF